MDAKKQNIISDIVKKHIEKAGNNFKADYDKNNGAKFSNIENKYNNIFISGLGDEVVVYSALMRSLDSSLGNTIEQMALEIAQAVGYKVSQGVSGNLSKDTIQNIALLLEEYKNKSNPKKVQVADYEIIKKSALGTEGKQKFHNSDYLLEKEINGVLELSLLELKIGGDLDNKKARSEKEAIFEQYAILVNQHKNRIKNGTAIINTYFATAYNKNSIDSGKEKWTQGSVKTFFAYEELLIGKDFWNFICDDSDGWDVIKEEYIKHSQILKGSIQYIVESLK